MTENLMQSLEEKIMTLLSEIESLRSSLHEEQQKNFLLEQERGKVQTRMSDLLGLFESLDGDQATQASESVTMPESAVA